MSQLGDRLNARYASLQQGRGGWDQAAAERWGRAQLHHLRGWLPEDRSAAIADAGCGSGWLINALHRRGHGRLAGVDRSPEQVELARTGTPTADIMQGDACAWLEGRRGAFSLVLAMDVIEHLDRDAALLLLERARGALAPEGALVLQTLNAASPFAGGIRYGDPTHEHAYTPHSIATILGLAGFERIEVREQGPIGWGYSLGSTLRWPVWQAVRLGMRLASIAEVGHADAVQTRTMLVRARAG